MAKLGRPTDALKHKFQRILEEAKSYEKFKHILKNNNKPDVFLKAFEMAHDRAYGKALQAIDMEMNDVTARPTAEDLNAALRSLNGDSKGNGVAEGEREGPVL